MKFGQLIGFTLILVSLYILWQIRQILLLLFMAIVLATALNLLVKLCQSYNIKRTYAILLAMMLLLGTIIGAFWLIIPALIEQIQELITLVPEGLQELNYRIINLIIKIEPNLESTSQVISDLLTQLQPLINKVANQGLNVFYSSLGILLSVLLLLALTLMLLANPQPYRQGLIRLFPSFYRRRVAVILQLCDQALCGWLTTVIFHIGVMLLLSWLGLFLLGIPLAFSQAFLSGFLTFIPNLGPILSMIAPIAIAFLEESWKPWAVIILYSVIFITIRELDQRVLVPLILNKHISLIPGVTLLAQIFFAYNFGFLGLFLAFPLLIIAQIWLKEALIKDILDREIIKTD